MRLKHGKKYETAGGVVYRVRKHPEFTNIWDVCDDTGEHWDEYGKGEYIHPDLIRRHYTKPKPAHKLGLKPGDVVELVAWEDGSVDWIGARLGHKSAMEQSTVKGQRPLFRVVSRASWTMPPS